MRVVYFVYLLTFKNGKVYVGMSKTDSKGRFDNRYYQHSLQAKNGKNLPIYNAWRLHGAPVQTIVSMHDNRADCAISEIDTIEKYDSTNIKNGYNITKGGQGQDSATNPVMYQLMREKVWNNPEWRKKVSNSLKGKKPSQATMDAYKKWLAENPNKQSENAKKMWSCQVFRAARSEITRAQMKNGGAAHLSVIFKGRPDLRSPEGKQRCEDARRSYLDSERGRKKCAEGYAKMRENPENVRKNRESLDAWRASDRNREQCKVMAQKSAEACSKKVMIVATGEVFPSQREAAKAVGITESAMCRWVKTGKCVRI